MYPERYDEINYFYEWKHRENLGGGAVQIERRNREAGQKGHSIRNHLSAILRRIMRRDVNNTQICIENL